MRSTSVSIERVIIHDECGSSCEPSVLRTERIFVISARAPVTPPATRSLCPPMYFVSEYTLRSMPCRDGFWYSGPSSVLSQTDSGR